MNNLFTQRVFTYTNFFSCFNSVVGRRKKSERIVSKETVRRGFATQRLEEIWHVIDFPNFASTFYSKRFGCVFFFSRCLLLLHRRRPTTISFLTIPLCRYFAAYQITPPQRHAIRGLVKPSKINLPRRQRRRRRRRFDGG